MAKISIYLPDDLKVRMDERPLENWSAVAQRAFELQINSTRKGGDDMNKVIERLRASKAKIEEVERPTWIAKGREWASDEAEYEQLERVGEISLEDYGDENDRNGFYRLRLLAAAGFNEPDIDTDKIKDLGETLTGTTGKTPSGRQVGWFIEGAQAVWEEVEDEI